MNTPSTVRKVNRFNTKPAYTSTCLKLGLRTKARVMTVCRTSARTGRPAGLRTASQRRAGKSSPMLCTMRGPANTIELMVDTSKAAMTAPVRRPTVGPKSELAAM